MVKLIESALKIVKINKRKWLLRLNQKVLEMGAALANCVFRDPIVSRSIAGT